MAQPLTKHNPPLPQAGPEAPTRPPRGWWVTEEQRDLWEAADTAYDGLLKGLAGLWDRSTPHKEALQADAALRVLADLPPAVRDRAEEVLAPVANHLTFGEQEAVTALVEEALAPWERWVDRLVARGAEPAHRSESLCEAFLARLGWLLIHVQLPHRLQAALSEEWRQLEALERECLGIER